MNGLSTLNIELTSRCNKSCWMCGRRKMEREHPEIEWGDMPYEMVEEIASQVPPGIVVQFHNNGEPLLYPRLGSALSLFGANIRCFNTNGKLLIEKADEVIGNLETLTVSVIQDDEEGDEQYEIVRNFIERKGGRSPFMVYRLLGEFKTIERYKHLPGTIARRIIHSPIGSYASTRPPTIPEIGICLDLLTRLAIDRFGNISLCVRFDTEGKLRIGNIKDMTLEEAWNSDFRKARIMKHIAGRRCDVPGCDRCDYWGVPRGE